MAKTFRTCKHGYLLEWCEPHCTPVWCESCESYKPRETPLLVDVLGEALKTLLDEDVLHEIVQQTKNFPNEPIVNLVDDVAPGVFAALARYKEEVGDA